MAKTYTAEQAEICANCENSLRLEGSDACICSKKGLVKALGTCRKFKLDLLKIEPTPAIQKNI